jgi:site-specific DNA recombinase
MRKRLSEIRPVSEGQLQLLQHPQELYRKLNDHGCRLLNQSMFEELLLEQEDLTIQVVGQTYTEPIRDLMLAAQADREQSDTRLQTTKSRSATNGEPAWRTLTSLLRPVSLDEGWSKTAMVELRGLEPLTPSMPWRCATSCATAPEPPSRASEV